MKQIPILITLLFISAGIIAQKPSIDDFSGLKSAGKLPACFRELSADKYKKDKESISKEETHFSKSSKKDFYLKNNFIIDDILLSGDILFGDPITEYINKVADKLLKDDPQLRSQLQFYTSKSQYVNAFATDQGIIFVNTGLIAKLNTEAELAFILAHEITHFKEKHSISMHIENEKMIKKRGKYRGVSFKDHFLNINTMSKDQESEADEYAYDHYYKQSDYCLDEIDSVFTMLLLARSPMGERKFDKAFFENDYFKMPEKYIKEELDTLDIEKVKDNDRDAEKESTHPATISRKKALGRMKIKESNEGRKKFIADKNEFEYVRTLARFESIRQMMIDQEYIDAIYNSYVLLEAMPNNKFLESTIASALYIMSTYSNNDKSISLDYSEQSTEIQQLAYFFKKIGSQELNVLAIKYLQDYIAEHGTSTYHENMMNQLMQDLFILHDLKRREFFSAEELQTDISLNDPAKEDNDLYFLNAFAYHMDDAAFYKKMGSFERMKAQKEKEEKRKENKSLARKSRKQKLKEERHEKYYGKELGIDKIAVVSPFYYKINPKKQEPLRLIESEKKQLRFTDRIEKCGTASGLDVEILNPKEYTVSSTDQFNCIGSLNEWFSERIDHETSFDIVPYCSQNIDRASQLLNTKHILWTGVFAVRKKKRAGSWIAASILVGYGISLPVVIGWAMIPSYETAYFSFLFDVESGKNELYVGQSINTSDLTGDFVNSCTYDSFYQIKKQAKN